MSQVLKINQIEFTKKETSAFTYSYLKIYPSILGNTSFNPLIANVGEIQTQKSEFSPRVRYGIYCNIIAQFLYDINDLFSIYCEETTKI